ncbi:MAG: hypothetical protein MUF71_12275 [Candidatus Kapabacteria bacterium]|jgi:hypothetical protein|nr:hypothetical protein [Candidatus Kapabacteria bacterium]
MIRSLFLRLALSAMLSVFCPHGLFAVGRNDSTAAQSTTQSTTSQEITPILMKQYIGISGSSVMNNRAVGLPAQYAEQIGNTPLLSLGISTVWWGDLLLHTNNIRTQMFMEKFLNAYPSPKLLENIRMGMEFGYALVETPTLKVYPFLGFSQAFITVDALARVSLLSANIGAGADYFLPNTPLAFSFQASYNHAWNLRAASEVPNSQPGIIARATVVVLLQTRRTYW